MLGFCCFVGEYNAKEHVSHSHFSNDFLKTLFQIELHNEFFFLQLIYGSLNLLWLKWNFSEVDSINTVLD